MRGSLLALTGAAALLCASVVLARPVCYVAPTGDDAASGTLERPVKQVQEAASRLRQALARGEEGPLEVVLRGGTYYLDQTLRLTDEDCGKPGQLITWKSFPGERAELVGGAPVTGWQRVDEHIFRARVGSDSQFSALFENGQWAKLARHPNSGYLHAEEAQTEGETGWLRWKPGDLPEFDPEDAFLTVWAGRHDFGVNYDWYTTLSPIAGVDHETRMLRLGSGTYWYLAEENRYFVSGARAFLDAPGEFWLDESEGWLYYWPRKLPIERQLIIAPKLKRLLEVQGSSMAQRAHNLAFESIDFSISDSTKVLAPNKHWSDGMVFLNNTRDISFRACRLRNAGEDCLMGSLANEKISLVDCWFSGAGFCGASFAGWPAGLGDFSGPEEAYISKFVHISNCYFGHCGQRVGQGSGLWLAHTGDTVIEHCLFEAMPRHAVNQVGGTYNLMQLPREHGGLGGAAWGHKITFENRLDFIFTRHNKLLYNECRNVMTDSSDGGAFYSWGVGDEMVIRGNFIHHLKAFRDDAYLVGIYLDDASAGFTVEDNLVARLRGTKNGYPYMIKGMDNTFRNNVSVDNVAAQHFYVISAGTTGAAESPPGAEDERIRNINLFHNIIHDEGAAWLYAFWPWAEDMLAESDYNLFYNSHDWHKVVVDWVAEDWEAWRARAGGKYDAHTRFADPLFVNRRTMDYRLRPDSPAFTLGIHSVDPRQAGLLPSFPFRQDVK